MSEANPLSIREAAAKELLPCPKCGSTKVGHDQFAIDRNRWVGECSDCDFMTETVETQAEATALWNVRARAALSSLPTYEEGVEPFDEGSFRIAIWNALRAAGLGQDRCYGIIEQAVTEYRNLTPKPSSRTPDTREAAERPVRKTEGVTAGETAPTKEASDAVRSSLCDAREADDTEEMAEIGRAFIEAIHDNCGHGFLKHWAPAEGPAEIIVDLLNALDDQAAEAREALTKAAERFREYERLHHAKLADCNSPRAQEAVMEKVLRNREMAEMCESAARKLGGEDE